MPPRSALSRVEPLALALALASPLAMLAIVPGGPSLLGKVLVGAIAFAAAYALYRLALRGRPPRPRRPALGPPPLGTAPEAARSSTFRVRRGGRVLLQGTYEDLVAAARAGRIEPFDVIVVGGGEAPPESFADLLPHVASRAETRARRLYLGSLAVVLAAATAGIALLAGARAAGEAGEEDLLLVLLFALAVAPLPFLRREWRRLADGRARGLVPEPPARATLGSPALDEALAGPAPATSRVLVAVVAVSVAALLLPPETLQLRLAKDNGAIRDGEVWRLLTAGLVHGGAFHLFINGMVLTHLGPFVERLLGSGRMLAVLWGGVLTGSLASLAMNPHRSVGISGGLFALVGALLAVGLRYRRTLPAQARRMLVRAPIEIIVLNLALGFSIPVIDNAAHMGGLAGGFLLGLVLPLRPAVGATLGRPAASGRSP